MKLLLLPNRLVRPTSALVKARISVTTNAQAYIQQRHATDDASAKADQEVLHPILREYYQNRPSQHSKMLNKGSDHSDAKVNHAQMPQNSIFGEDSKEVEQQTEEAPKRDLLENADERSLDMLNVALDPRPLQRWRWERARMIKDVRRGWRISKEDYLKRTERKCVENSVWLKTSVKKLSLLARQVAGKNIEEALLQLRFSKKRSADEVAKHLEHARDMAIVKWGMGLGEAENRKGDPIEIRLKDGTKKMITDRTAIYIEQAMVQRGGYELQPEIRARGRMNILRKPYTAIRFILKEEHTRIREYEEKQVKKLRKTPFTPLPDKPITQQRQYVLW